jgi:hypothetical protein
MIAGGLTKPLPGDEFKWTTGRIMSGTSSHSSVFSLHQLFQC